MPAPTVRFLGGVREIGGNKVVVEDGHDRILFDFGPSFNPLYEQYFVDYLRPRSTSMVKDLLEFGLLPRVEGLYAKEHLAHSDLEYREPEFSAVFVTHAHADHAGYLELIDPEIPVYVGEGTRALLQTIDDSTNQRYGEHDWHTFSDSRPIPIGPIEVTPYPVDHSIPFAFGYLVRTRDGSFAYTGDFRQHGPRASDSHAFFEALAEAKPEGFAIEGTRAGPDPRKNFSEQGVRESVDGLLKETPDIAFACTYPRDIDRLTTLYRAAAAAGRTFVVSFRTAYLLQEMAGWFPTGAIPVPGVSPNLAVYGRRKKIYAKYERPFLDDALDASDLAKQGREYLLALDFSHFGELIDIRPPKGSPFVHSMSEPFCEDDLSDQVLHNWLDHFGLRFHQAHASGHASESELFEIVRHVDPGHLYPIHTEHPEEFRKIGPRVRLPELGERYPLRGAS
ncbi:MAG: MBL fold metallo-hydrolase [Thermoplasmata archaeon]